MMEELSAFRAAAEKRQAEEQAQAEAEREERRSEQIELGFCDLNPFSKKAKEATQPFRSELTIEKHSLFVSNHYKGDFFVREWTTRQSNSDEKILHRLTVGRTDEGNRTWGVLTQTHQDVFYKLLRMWGEKKHPLVGKDPGSTYGSLVTTAYELVHVIRGSTSASDYRRVRDLLQELISIPVVLENAYTWQGLEDRFQFTLLGDVDWSDRGVDKKTKLPKVGKKSRVTILFSSRVTEGFLHRNIKTMLSGPYQALGTGSRARGETARLLYPLLDAQLATKKSFHICLSPLAERFGLRSYRYKSDRRHKFAPAVQMLNGKLIQGGEYRLRVSLRLSEDDADYVLHAYREPPNQLSFPVPSFS